MPRIDSPFGSLPTNLPQPQGLPVSQVGNTRQQQTAMPMGAPAAPSTMAPARSELESILSGFGGLLKQQREDEEKKKAAEDAKTLAEQIAGLQAQRQSGAFRPATTQEERIPGDFVSPKDIESYMSRNATFESGDNPYAVNKGSGATGTYQFLPSTWNWIAKEAPDLGLTSEGITDAAQQAKAMRYYTQKSANILAPILGRKPSGGELYLLHLLGHSGGPEVLKNLDAPITETISSGAYLGNPFLKQYTTGRDLIAGLNRTFGGGEI